MYEVPSQDCAQGETGRTLKKRIMRLLSMFLNTTTTSPGMKPLSQLRRPTGDKESKKPPTSEPRNDELRLLADTQQHMAPTAGTMQNI